MKSIELTEEHKSKLLKMCKNLFPEQEFYWEYEMYGRGLKEDFNDVLQVYFKDKEAWKRNLFPFNIHWFEFCMTHLQNQILIKASELNKSDDLDYDFFGRLTDSWYKSHPVNYLYKQFKKLK